MSVPVEVQPRPDFYVLGGALKTSAPSYVERQADKILLESVRNREFCYVLTPRQMGKTSLMIRTASALRSSGVRTAIIDLTQLGASLTPDQWYLGQLMRIVKDLGIVTDYLGWWQQQSHLGPVQRFVNFLSDVVLSEIREPVAIFVDEIDTTLNLSFSDDYFAAIRSFFNERASDPRLDRLTFVLLGVASPSDLIRDAKRTPFNIGMRIALTDFSEQEASALLPGLAPDSGCAALLLKQVLFWTGGHPYLTQKTCKEIAAWAASPAWATKDVPLIVDSIIKLLFFSEQGRNQDFNLQFVRDRILESGDSAALLTLYRRIRSGETVTDDELEAAKMALKLSGLVIAGDSRLLKVRNRVYDRVFDDVWIAGELRRVSPLSETLVERVAGLIGGRKTKRFKHDVFISHSMRDSLWVQEFLAPNLLSAGLNIFYWTITPGQEWEKALDDGFTQSRCIVAVMSPDYFASETAQLEVEKALRLLGGASSGRRLIPILLRSADIPHTLRSLQYIDFRNPDLIRKSGFPQLLAALGAQGHGTKFIDHSVSTNQGFDTGVIRRLLDDAFDPDDLEAFIYDYFRSARTAVQAAQTKKARIQSLIEKIENDGEMDRLLDLMARDHPTEYRRYADLLQRAPS